MKTYLFTCRTIIPSFMTGKVKVSSDSFFKAADIAEKEFANKCGTKTSYVELLNAKEVRQRGV